MNRLDKAEEGLGKRPQTIICLKSMPSYDRRHTRFNHSGQHQDVLRPRAIWIEALECQEQLGSSGNGRLRVNPPGLPLLFRLRVPSQLVRCGSRYDELKPTESAVLPRNVRTSAIDLSHKSVSIKTGCCSPQAVQINNRFRVKFRLK